MIAKSYIYITLKSLDSKYRRTNSNRDSLLFSKIAILELCGWIEESMDDMVIRCAYKHLREESNKKFVKEEIVKHTSGFEYKKHFKGMLIRLIGLIHFERLEQTIDQQKLNNLKSTLSSLKKIRNKEAHTHIKGVANSINAPSTTLDQFEKVYAGLLEFDRVLRNTMRPRQQVVGYF